MTVFSELCMEPVSATDGVPMGIDGYDDYRFVLQAAITTRENALPFTLGTSQLGGPRWRDITSDVQGMTWTRGAEPAQRPIAGELSFRLNNPEYEWSPWYESSEPIYAPGPVLKEDFNNFTNWVTSGSPAPAIVAGRTDTGARIQNNSSNTGIASYSIPSGSQSDWLIVGTAWKIDSVTNDPHVMEFWSDNNTTFHCHLGARSDGSLGFSMGGILLGWSAAGLIALNTFYYIEVRVHLGDNPTGSWEIRLNGVVVASLASCDTKNSGTKTVFDTIRLTTHTLGTITSVYDDLYIDSGASATYRGDPLNWAADEPTTPFYLYGPGTMVRIAVGNGTTLLPQFCGQVQSWNEAAVGLDAYKYVDVTVWENLYLLAEVDDHGLAGVVGGGETLTQRVDRLLTQANWQFDRDIADTTGATFQSTNLAQDVATEMYLTVDSVDATVFPAKDGMLLIRNRSTGTGNHWTLRRENENPDSIVTGNDDERILSSVDLARVGGTSMTFTNVGLASRYQRRSTQRNDMITVSEAGNADLQRVADGMLARARMTYRPVSVELQSGHGPAAAKLMIETDLTDRLTLDYGPVIFHSYAICAFAHSVIVAAAGVYWTTTISLDIEQDSSWAKRVNTPARWGQAKWGRNGWA